jgi:hypothetical protein
MSDEWVTVGFACGSIVTAAVVLLLLRKEATAWKLAANESMTMNGPKLNDRT